MSEPSQEQHEQNIHFLEEVQRLGFGPEREAFGEEAERLLVEFNGFVLDIIEQQLPHNKDNPSDPNRQKFETIRRMVLNFFHKRTKEGFNELLQMFAVIRVFEKKKVERTDISTIKFSQPTRVG